MSRLLLASTAGGILIPTWAIGVPLAARPVALQLGLGPTGVRIVAGLALGLPLILFFVALSRYPRMVMRGTAFGKHGFWRVQIVGLPALLVMLATIILCESLKPPTIP